MLGLRVRLAVILVGIAAGSLCLCPTAWASDTFTLTNNSSYTLPYYGGSPLPCSSGVFAATSTSDSFNAAPGSSSSVTLSQSPFSSCDATYPSTSIPVGTVDGVPGGGLPVNYGANPPLWYFDPDDPVAGSASLSCYDNSYMAQYVAMSASGMTCTATNTPSTPTINIISSLAVTDDPHYALVSVELFAKNRRAAAHVEVRLTRHGASSTGHNIDVGRDELLVGWPQLIMVPLDPATRQLVAKGKEVKLRAVVGRDDGGRGKGDRKMLVVREYRGDPLR